MGRETKCNHPRVGFLESGPLARSPPPLSIQIAPVRANSDISEREQQNRRDQRACREASRLHSRERGARSISADHSGGPFGWGAHLRLFRRVCCRELQDCSQKCCVYQHALGGHELLLAPVMIASHCLGSPFAPLQYSQKLRQDLEADSRVLVQIQDLQLQPVNSHKESRPRFYNLAGSLDVLTASSRHIAAKNAFWYCLLPHVGHSSILLSRTMWDQVFDWLRAKSSSTHSSHIYDAPVCGQVDPPSMNVGHLALGSAYASTGADARGGDCTHAWQRSACNLTIEGA